MNGALPNAGPTVSVVMPVYNTQAYLTHSIDSILGQTFQDWELICVNDGSSDGSLEILRRYEGADPRVRVITRSHSGNNRARNVGMALARGRYIAAMDSDDVALPERLHQQVDYMECHPKCVGLGAAVRVVGPDLLPIRDEAPRWTTKQLISKRLLVLAERFASLSHCSVQRHFDRSAVIAMNTLSPKISICTCG
jgi:glycosyltransferase involved in cell wall biosynthesis